MESGTGGTELSSEGTLSGSRVPSTTKNVNWYSSEIVERVEVFFCAGQGMEGTFTIYLVWYE